MKLLIPLWTVTSEDVCWNIRNVLWDIIFVFRTNNLFYRKQCLNRHCASLAFLSIELPSQLQVFHLSAVVTQPNTYLCHPFCQGLAKPWIYGVRLGRAKIWLFSSMARCISKWHRARCEVSFPECWCMRGCAWILLLLTVWWFWS